MSEVIIRHPSDDIVPTAMKTIFGYIIIGENHREAGQSRNNGKIGRMFIHSRLKTSLESQVEKFWKLDSIEKINQSRVLTKEERDAETKFEESLEFFNNCYCDKLPFRNDAPELSCNFYFLRK